MTKILDEREKWYSQRFVQFEIIKCLKNRELCFLTQKGLGDSEIKRAVRYLLAFSIDYLLKHMDWFNFLDFHLNMYHSTAVLKPEVPVFSYNLKERNKAPEYDEFNKNYSNYISGFNFLFDIDGKETENLQGEKMLIKKTFDDFKIPYYVLNSSKNGFHFVIPAMYMPKGESRELLETMANVAFNFKGIFILKGLDTSIYDNKRVQKVPYSYSCDGSICLPLNDEQLENFTPELVSFDNVMRTIMIKDRGLLIRTHGLSEEELKANVERFLREFK